MKFLILILLSFSIPALALTDEEFAKWNADYKAKQQKETEEKAKNLDGPTRGEAVVTDYDKNPELLQNIGEDTVRKNACSAYQSVRFAESRIDGLMRIEKDRDLNFDEGQDLIRNRRVIRNDAPRYKNLAITYKKMTGHALNIGDCDGF